MPGIIWIALIGLLAGLIARFLLPGPNNPPGFLVTMGTRKRRNGDCKSVDTAGDFSYSAEG